MSVQPDRLSDGYEPNFDLDREIGRQGELFVSHIAESLTRGLAEVKYEPSASKYGNVYLEYACRRNGVYQPSGIDETGSDVWAWTLGRHRPQIMVAAPVPLVRGVKDRALREGQIRNTIRGSHPTNGAIVSLRDLLRWLLNEADGVAA